MKEFWLMHWGPSLLPPAVRTVWGWRIALAYFLAGTGSMTMFLAAYEDWRKRAASAARMATAAGLAGIAIALLLFVTDLGEPMRFLHLAEGWATRLTSSAMSWGALALTILPALGIISWLRGKQPGANRPYAPWIMLFGVLSTIYPGFLLGATAVGLWQSYMPLFFLATSLTVASAFMAVVAAITLSDQGERQAIIRRMEGTSLVSTGAEIVFLAFVLFAASGNTHALPALHVLIAGSIGPYFWLGVVLTVAAGIGLLWPTVGNGNRQAAGSGGLTGVFLVAASGSFLLRLSFFLAGFALYSASNPFGSYTLQLP